MTRYLIISAAMLASIAGCTTSYSTTAPEAVADKVSIVDSEFDANRLYAAPEITGGDVLIGPRYSARLMTSQAKKTGEVTQILLVTWSYSAAGWLYFQSASLPGAATPQTRIVSRKVTTCSGRSCAYEETLATVIPLEMLAAAHDGLKVRYNSQGGWAMVELSKNYILGYLQGTAKVIQQ